MTMRPKPTGAGPACESQVLHDTAVYRAARLEIEAIEARGGRIHRIRTEADLQKLASRHFARARRNGDGMGHARAAAAADLGLAEHGGRLAFPDVRIEYRDPGIGGGTSGSAVVDLEVITSDYRSSALRAKAAAGFQIYSMAPDGSLSQGVFRTQPRNLEMTGDSGQFPQRGLTEMKPLEPSSGHIWVSVPKDLRDSGYSTYDAAFLTASTLLGSYFLRRQYRAWGGRKPGSSESRFLSLVEGLGHAKPLVRKTLYCVHSRQVLAAIGGSGRVGRSLASRRYVKQRLLALDYLIESGGGQRWLLDEAEKVAYFRSLGIERRILPASRPNTVGNVRRFPSPFPIRAAGAGQLTVGFVYSHWRGHSPRHGKVPRLSRAPSRGIKGSRD